MSFQVVKRRLQKSIELKGAINGGQRELEKNIYFKKRLKIEEIL